MKFRDLTLRDIPSLKAVNGSLTSNSRYKLVRLLEDLELTYKLDIEHDAGPYNFPDNYSCEEGDESQYCTMISDITGWGRIAINNGVIVAFCICQEHKVTHSLYVEGIFVDLSIRGNGIGRTLISSIFKEAGNRNLSSIWLKTENTNMPACKFYESCGFRIIGFKENLSKLELDRTWNFAIYWGFSILENKPLSIK